jgi:hypothetical protein
MNEGSLFCFVLQVWDPLNGDAWDCVLDVVGKLLTRRRKRSAWAWFQDDVWTCCAKVLEYWMIFFSENKLTFESFIQSRPPPKLMKSPSWWNNDDGHHIFNSQGPVKSIALFLWWILWWWSKVLPSTNFQLSRQPPKLHLDFVTLCSTCLCCYCWIWKAVLIKKTKKKLLVTPTKPTMDWKRGGLSRAQLRKKIGHTYKGDDKT